jgi:hypothetical protein
MFKTLWQIAIVLMITTNAWAQSDSKIVMQTLATYYNGDYSGDKLFALPASINKFLPDVLLAERRKEMAFKAETNKFASLIKKTKLFKATEYVDSRPRKNRDGTIKVRAVYDRAWFPSIELNGKRYVFSEDDIAADIEVFNLFLNDAQISVESEPEALELTKLFFYFARGYSEHQGKQILSNIESIPALFRRGKDPQVEKLRNVVESPRVTFQNGKYQVELYAWESVLGRVVKWDFTIASNSLIAETKEVGIV